MDQFLVIKAKDSLIEKLTGSEPSERFLPTDPSAKE